MNFRTCRFGGHAPRSILTIPPTIKEGEDLLVEDYLTPSPSDHSSSARSPSNPSSQFVFGWVKIAMFLFSFTLFPINWLSIIDNEVSRLEIGFNKVCIAYTLAVPLNYLHFASLIAHLLAEYYSKIFSTSLVNPSSWPNFKPGWFLDSLVFNLIWLSSLLLSIYGQSYEANVFALY